MDVFGLLFGLPFLLSPIFALLIGLWIFASYQEGEQRRRGKVMSRQHQAQIMECLGSKVFSDDVESAHRDGGRPFGERYEEWKRFVARMEVGDELREFLVPESVDCPDWNRCRSGYARLHGVQLKDVFFKARS